NNSGELGDGSTTDRQVPVVAIPEDTLPGVPTGDGATAGVESATVSWTAPGGTGSGTVTGYTVTAHPGGKTCTTTGATQCTVLGLAGGTAYTFTVVTDSTVGDSAASSAAGPVLPAARQLPATVPTTVENLTSSRGRHFTVARSLTTVSGRGFAANTPVTIGIY